MLASIETPRRFILSCLKFGEKAKIDLEQIGKIEIPDEVEGWKRARLYVFYCQALSIFENRVKFVMDAVDKGMGRLEVMDQILRGMLELYCRFLSIVRAEEIDKFRRIIWQDLITYCNLFVDPKHVRQVSPLLKINYKILKNIGEDVSSLDISIIKKEVTISYENMKETTNFRKLRERMEFPSVKRILLKYYDESEEPIISKKDIYQLYSRLSEQIHGNIYYEIPDAPAEMAIYRIFASVILLHMKFHREVALISRNDEGYKKLLREFYNLKPDFSHLWNLTKKL